MGETMADRVDFLARTAIARAGRGADQLHQTPRPGTPLADQSLVGIRSRRSSLRRPTRLALPASLVRFAGGREITLRGLQDLGMRSGASGLVVGNYLTTQGREANDDFAMLERLGFEVM